MSIIIDIDPVGVFDDILEPSFYPAKGSNGLYDLIPGDTQLMGHGDRRNGILYIVAAPHRQDNLIDAPVPALHPEEVVALVDPHLGGEEIRVGVQTVGQMPVALQLGLSLQPLLA